MDDETPWWLYGTTSWEVRQETKLEDLERRVRALEYELFVKSSQTRSEKQTETINKPIKTTKTVSTPSTSSSKDDYYSRTISQLKMFKK